MFAIPGMGLWTVVWPFIRAALAAIARPFMDPNNWIGLAVVGALLYAYAWNKGDSHGDRQCEARIERDRVEQDRKIREAGEEVTKWLDLFNKEKDKTNELQAKLDAETAADATAGGKCFGPSSVRRINRIKGRSK